MRICAGAAIIGMFGIDISSARGQCEAAKLMPDDGHAGQFFGADVAVRGDVVLVGASYDVGSGAEAGAVYVYRRDGLTWIEEAKLLASDAEELDRFGSATAVDGTVALVGAWGDDDAYQGHQSCNSGAAYVFRRTGEGWVQEAKLLAPEPEWGDHVGYAVDLDGDIAVLGAPCDNDGGIVSGIVYVFRYEGGAWSCEATLNHPYPSAHDSFGYSVAVRGNRLMIGCTGDDDFGMDAGSVFVFEHDGSGWVEQAKLRASDVQDCDEFGTAVDASGDLLVVGARWNDVYGPGSGSAYVFGFDGGQWPEEARLLASDGATEDQFGFAVATNGQAVVVGAHRDDDLGIDSGSVYIFRDDGAAWFEHAKLLASDGRADDRLGASLAYDGPVVVAGAPRHDLNGENAGAAYIYDDLGEDCNVNGICDSMDILNGTSCDINDNGVPDECEDLCVGDVDEDGHVGTGDLLALLAAWGPCPPEGACMADVVCDGVINVPDLLVLLGQWGPCPRR
ncbi:MAG: FG-GAP repeat protein [Planctomycetota bacterium]|nr:FG-GAP repeat protein [Planctomycetota bacterium]